MQQNGDKDTPDGGGPIEDALKAVETTGAMTARPPEKIIAPTGNTAVLPGVAPGGQPASDSPKPATVPSAGPVDPVWQHPGAPLNPTDNKTGGVDGLIKPGSKPGPASPPPLPPAKPLPPAASPSHPATGAPEDTLHDLLTIKQQALSDLSPLIGQLDQPAEDRFRTLMMMIQASDDQTMIKVAYSVAETIEDEKVRAQALLDIVNEINYFTSQHHQQ